VLPERVVRPEDGRAVLAGRYALLRELERGATGSLALAEDLSTGQMLMLASAPRSQDEHRARAGLQREAEVIARLDHPSIVQTRGVVRGEEGVYLLPFEAFQGDPLDEVAACWHRDTACGWSAFPVRKAVRVALALCEALAHAHERGVVHGTLRPTCVLAAPTGEIRIAGWGAARVQGDPSSTSGGRPAVPEPDDLAQSVRPYLAPEVLRSGTPEATPVSDVFGIAAVLFHLLAGTPPPASAGSRASLEGATRKTPAMSTPYYQTPAALRSVCLRALDAQPQRRYLGPAELGADLHAWLEGRGGMAFRWSPLAALAASVERRPRAARIASAGLLGAAGLLVLASALARREQVIRDWTRTVATEGSERARAQLQSALEAELEGLAWDGPSRDEARQRYFRLLVQFGVLPREGEPLRAGQAEAALSRPQLQPVRVQLDEALWGLARTTPAASADGLSLPTLEQVLAILEPTHEAAPVGAALAAWSRADAAALRALLEREDGFGWGPETAEHVADAALALGLAGPAARLYRTVSDALPEHWRARVARAIALAQTGDSSQAAAELATALACVPSSAAVRALLSAALEADSRRDEARGELERALALEPAGTPFHAELERRRERLTRTRER